MLISDKYRRPWSDAAHHARRLIRAYAISSAIRSFFVDDVTNKSSNGDWAHGLPELRGTRLLMSPPKRIGARQYLPEFRGTSPLINPPMGMGGPSGVRFSSIKMHFSPGYCPLHITKFDFISNGRETPRIPTPSAAPICKTKPCDAPVFGFSKFCQMTKRLAVNLAWMHVNPGFERREKLIE